jgi:signal transduction histidine kinase
MEKRLPPVLPRRLLVVILVLALFVAFDLSLFGWLIFRSLSQREIEQVLLDTRAEAEGLARQLEGRAKEEDDDLYTAVATERETQSYINSILQQRDLLQDIEIRDNNGVLVFKARTTATIPNAKAPAQPAVGNRELPNQLETRTIDRSSVYHLEVPIGELGILHIGISQSELEQRISVLRRELIRQAAFIGLVTLIALLCAALVLRWLWRRTQRAELRAREQERLAYLGTLASGLAHEIRNPLNSLSLNMQLIEEEVGEVYGEKTADNGRGLLAITRSEIGRLERLVTDFLAYARPQKLNTEDVRAVDLLDHVRQVLAAQIQERGVEVTVEDETEGAQIHVDVGLFNQLLLNLVQNSLHATENVGRPARIQLSARARDDRILLQVTDNGCGVAPEERQKMFDLFYSTRKGGTGLGLAIVERIARAHDAELEVVSMRGSGTTIRVSLPAVPGRSVSHAKQRSVPQPATSSS